MSDTEVGDVSKLTVVQLREQCTKHGLATTGKKAELVERLKAATAVAEEVKKENDTTEATVEATNGTTAAEEPKASEEEVKAEIEETKEEETEKAPEEEETTKDEEEVMDVANEEVKGEENEPGAKVEGDKSVEEVLAEVDEQIKESTTYEVIDEVTGDDDEKVADGEGAPEGDEVLEGDRGEDDTPSKEDGKKKERKIIPKLDRDYIKKYMMIAKKVEVYRRTLHVGPIEISDLSNSVVQDLILKGVESHMKFLSKTVSDLSHHIGTLEIKFQNVEAMTEAVEANKELEIDGRKIQVYAAYTPCEDDYKSMGTYIKLGENKNVDALQTYKREHKKYDEALECRSLYVKNLPKSVTEEKMKELFEDAVAIYAPRDATAKLTGECFVEYESQEKAAEKSKSIRGTLKFDDQEEEGYVWQINRKEWKISEKFRESLKRGRGRGSITRGGASSRGGTPRGGIGRGSATVRRTSSGDGGPPRKIPRVTPQSRPASSTPKRGGFSPRGSGSMRGRGGRGRGAYNDRDRSFDRTRSPNSRPDMNRRFSGGASNTVSNIITGQNRNPNTQAQAMNLLVGISQMLSHGGQGGNQSRSSYQDNNSWSGSQRGGYGDSYGSNSSGGGSSSYQGGGMRAQQSYSSSGGQWRGASSSKSPRGGRSYDRGNNRKRRGKW
ncbi:unnamed protein product [Owenia fusiformis]|uniref:SAP domain-containing protein n=1 Tax=Owenia fusiformis TaxID=6347 RepID=A0A8S4PJN6_OWEFU|nr:unnamed protein product [Owenia fusiformis]